MSIPLFGKLKNTVRLLFKDTFFWEFRENRREHRCVAAWQQAGKPVPPPEFADKARRRFRSTPHIHILQGDSGAVLPELLEKVRNPCLFWLDGHYSGGITARADLDTPILKELQSILNHACKEHVIIIDDARLFNGTHDYPTIETLRQLIAAQRPNYDFSVANDSIRIHPAKSVNTSY